MRMSMDARLGGYYRQLRQEQCAAKSLLLGGTSQRTVKRHRPGVRTAKPSYCKIITYALILPKCAVAFCSHPSAPH
jgi:hypothetical protein